MSVFLDNVAYLYKQTDGTYKWPNSAEGDQLKRAHKELSRVQAFERKLPEIFAAIAEALKRLVNAP